MKTRLEGAEARRTNQLVGSQGCPGEKRGQPGPGWRGRNFPTLGGWGHCGAEVEAREREGLGLLKTHRLLDSSVAVC